MLLLHSWGYCYIIRNSLILSEVFSPRDKAATAGRLTKALGDDIRERSRPEIRRSDLRISPEDCSSITLINLGR